MSCFFCSQRAAPPIDYFSRSIAAVMLDVKIERAVLVGHSMGAPVVGQFHKLHPEKTLGLVLVDGRMEPMGIEIRGDYRTEAPPLIDSWLIPVQDVKLRGEIRAAMLSTPDHVAISAMEGMADKAAYNRGPVEIPVLAILAKTSKWPAGTDLFFRRLAPKLDLISGMT